MALVHSPQDEAHTQSAADPSVVAFSAALEAVFDVHARKLNDNQFITVLTAALDRAHADACEPHEGPTNLRARLATVRQSLEEQAAARLDPAMPVLVPEVVESLREYAECGFCSDDREDRVEAHGLFMLCDWQDALRAVAEKARTALPDTQPKTPSQSRKGE